jgi:hypothetical protein
MLLSEAPRFLLRKPKAPKLSVIQRRKAKKAKGRASPPRTGDAPDLSTPEMAKRQKLLIEVRERSSTGHPTMVGARVEAQFPHDRYKVRQLLDPANEWRNLMLWQGAERIRMDFEASGLGPRMCSSFEPRVSSGNQQWESDTQVDAMKRYKRAMNSLGHAHGASETPRPFQSCFWRLVSGGWQTDSPNSPRWSETARRGL